MRRRIICNRRKSTVEGKDTTNKECDGVEPCQKEYSGTTVRKRQVRKIMGTRSARFSGIHTYEGIFVRQPISAYFHVSLE